jgi:transglutaminase-like putative cysteine protease
MVASAFAAVALSGELPQFWILFTVAAGAISFFIEPARVRIAQSRAWRIGWNLVAFALFAWSIGEAIRGEALVLCIVRMSCFLLIFKLWNRRASKDYLQAYAVSFIMLAAGAILNTDLAFALCFVAYVATATWTLTLFHLRREMEENYLLKHSDDAQSERVEVERILNSRRVVGPAFLAGTSLVSLGIFLGSAAIFFLFPRVGFGIFFHHGRNGMRMGFNDSGVELGANGLVKDNEQVVMRVEFPDGKPAAPLYFRGVAFERYQKAPDGRTAGWSMSPGTRRWELRSSAGVTSIRGLGPLAPFAAKQINGIPSRKDAIRLTQNALRQEIYLEPMGEVSALFVATTPIGVEMPPSRETGPPQPLPEGDLLGDIFSPGRQVGIKYTALSTLRPPSREALNRDDPVPPGMDAALEVPPDLPQRVKDLARDLTKDAKNPREKAEAISRYLGGFRYTTHLSRDYDLDPLDDFLFEQKAGHCEYFATALAIMLRTVGVPARHIAGFYGGEWNSYGNYLQVRQRDAHAWVEVWLGQEAGWVAFDPTPPGEGAGASNGFLDRMRQIADTIQLAWFKWVIEYDLGKQVDIFQGLRKWFSSDGSGTQGSRATNWLAFAKRYKIEIGIAVAGLAALFTLWRRRRLITRGGSRRSPTGNEIRAQHALERAMRALEKRGATRAASETAAELATRVRAAGDPGAASFAELVDLYYAARFGEKAIAAAELDRLATAVVRPPQNGARVL